MLAVSGRGCSLAVVRELLVVVASLIAETGSGALGLR